MHDQLPTLPQYTSSGVQATCKSACGPYIDYAKVYASHDKHKLRVLRERNHDVYEKVRACAHPAFPSIIDAEGLKNRIIISA